MARCYEGVFGAPLPSSCRCHYFFNYHVIASFSFLLRPFCTYGSSRQHQLAVMFHANFSKLALST